MNIIIYNFDDVSGHELIDFSTKFQSSLLFALSMIEVSTLLNNNQINIAVIRINSKRELSYTKKLILEHPASDFFVTADFAVDFLKAEPQNYHKLNSKNNLSQVEII